MVVKNVHMLQFLHRLLTVANVRRREKIVIKSCTQLVKTCASFNRCAPRTNSYKH